MTVAKPPILHVDFRARYNDPLIHTMTRRDNQNLSKQRVEKFRDSLSLDMEIYVPENIDFPSHFFELNAWLNQGHSMLPKKTITGPQGSTKSREKRPPV